MKARAYLLALAFASPAGWSETAHIAVKIPPVRGETFAGNTISIPEALHGHPGVLVIGFTQTSREAVTLWGEWLAQEALGKAPMAYYEMPVLASVPKMLRGFVTGRIKTVVADPAKPHFLVLLDHEAEWRSIAHFATPDDAYVLLIDGQGYVWWQTHGPPTDQNRRALLENLATVRQQQAGSR